MKAVILTRVSEAIHPGTRCFKYDRNRPKPYQNTGFLNKSVV